MLMPTRWRIRTVPAPLLFVVGGISMYAGAAVAVDLFDQVSPTGVAWLRVTGAALVLLVWRRPGAAAWRGRRVVVAGAFGLVTAAMNVAFYESIDRLPLGTAVAIEFCGPVAVAAALTRGRRDGLAVLAAATGVALIADVQLGGEPTGFALALVAAACWAGYILLASRVAEAGSGIDDLAVGFTLAAVLLCPLALAASPVVGSPDLLALGLGVGLLSTVVPYVLDQIVVRRTGPGRFALLLALLPATATLTGLVALGQVPAWRETVGIAFVVLAVALRSRSPGEREPLG